LLELFSSSDVDIDVMLFLRVRSGYGLLHSWPEMVRRKFNLLRFTAKRCYSYAQA